MTIYPVTEIVKKPIFPNGGNLYVGESAEITCEVENHELWQDKYEGTIAWQKNEEYIPLQSERYIIGKNSLKIISLEEGDSGNLQIQ